MVGTGSQVEVVGIITTSKGKEYASSIEKMEIAGKEQPALTSTTNPAFLNLLLFLGDVCCILKSSFRRFRHTMHKSLLLRAFHSELA